MGSDKGNSNNFTLGISLNKPHVLLPGELDWWINMQSNYIKAQAHSELDFRINSLEDFTIDKLFTDDIERIVNQTLESLPEQTRRIFRMSRFEHKRNSEIANELHISTKAVEFHITKALKVLRVNLKDYILCFLILFL